MKKITLISLGASLAALPVFGAWTLVDDFESYNTGDFSPQWSGTDWSAISGLTNTDEVQIILGSNQPTSNGVFGSSKVFYMEDFNESGDGSTRISRALGSNSIAEGSTGTLYYEFAFRGDGFNEFIIGLDDSSNAQYPFSAHTGGTNGVFEGRGESDGTFNSEEDIASLQGNTIYKVWHVFDNDLDEYSVWLQSDGDATYATQTQVVSGWTFIDAQHNDTALSRVNFQNAFGKQSAVIDNIYIDPTSQNLSAIPEPSSFALLSGCLALIGAMVRRR